MPRRFTVRLSGPRVASGRLSVDDLSRLAQGLQLALKRTGLREAGRPGKAAGRLPKEIEAACSLDFIGFGGGSVTVSLALREPEEQLSLLQDVGEQALELLLQDLSVASGNPPPGISFRLTGGASEEGQAPQASRLELGVIEPLLDVTGLLERGIDRMEFFRDEPGTVSPIAVVDRQVRAHLRALIERPAPAEASVVGVLLEVDFKDGTAEVYEASGNVVRLAFDHEEDERLRTAAKSRVRAYGTARRDPAGRIVQLALQRLEILEEGPLEQDTPRLPNERALTPWRSIDDPFASAQPLRDVSILVGGLPDDRSPEEILADLRSSRQERSAEDY